MKKILFILPLSLAFASETMIDKKDGITVKELLSEYKILADPAIEQKIEHEINEIKTLLKNVRDENTYTSNPEQIEEYKEFFKSEIERYNNRVNTCIKHIVAAAEDYITDHLDDDLLNSGFTINENAAGSIKELQIQYTVIEVLKNVLKNLENPKPRKYKHDFILRGADGEAIGINSELVADISTPKEFNDFVSDLYNFRYLGVWKFNKELHDVLYFNEG